MTQVSITRYTEGANCDHCGRALRHGITLSDGRTVGATCLANKLSAPKTYNGRSYRVAADTIVHAAKVVTRVNPARWLAFGVNESVTTFELVGAR